VEVINVTSKEYDVKASDHVEFAAIGRWRASRHRKTAAVTAAVAVSLAVAVAPPAWAAGNPQVSANSPAHGQLIVSVTNATTSPSLTCGISVSQVGPYPIATIPNIAADATQSAPVPVGQLAPGKVIVVADCSGPNTQPSKVTAAADLL
jgi:hypothetical protein